MTGTTGRRRLPYRAFADLQLPRVSLEVQEAIAHQATQRRDEAERLQREAKAVVLEAKAQVERKILGEETSSDG